MTFPTFEEIAKACLRFHERGGRIISGTWGDGKTCACPLTAVADLRGSLPTNGLSSSNVTSVLRVDGWETTNFVSEYDAYGETSDLAELGARVAKFVDAHELYLPRPPFPESLEEDE